MFPQLEKRIREAVEKLRAQLVSFTSLSFFLPLPFSTLSCVHYGKSGKGFGNCGNEGTEKS